MVVAELDGSGGGRLLLDGVPLATVGEESAAAARAAAQRVAAGLMPDGCRLDMCEPGRPPQTEQVDGRGGTVAGESGRLGAHSGVDDVDGSRRAVEPRSALGAVSSSAPARHQSNGGRRPDYGPAATAEAGRLNLSDVSQQTRPVSRKWWRRLVGLGPAADERAADDQLTILNRQFTRTQVAVMTSIKGGSPKTSTTVQTAEALAENSGHQVVVLSADPANGNTGERIIDFPDDDALLGFPTAIDLYQAEMAARADGGIGLTDAHEIDRFLGHAGRTRVCMARQLVDDESDDSADIGLTADQITVLLECLSRVATVILVDCGTNPCTGAHKTLLSRADAVVIAAISRFDVLKKGEQSLDFIAGRRPDGLSKTVLALSHTDQGRPQTRVDPQKAVGFLALRVGGGLVEIPYDPHIAGGTAIEWRRLSEANRQAAVTLAAAMVDLFTT